MNIVITGGHTGIGLELLKKLLEQDNDIALVMRHPKRIQALPASIQDHPRIKHFFADLSVRGDLDRLSDEIAKQFDYVDVLFNNAGVLLDGLYYSQQGNEMHFEVNTLAPYFLTKKLAPLLRKSSDGLVVNTLTDGLHSRKKLDIKELLQPTSFKKLFGAYMASKHALLLLMNDQAEKETGFRILNVGPGPNKTPMTAGNGMPMVMKFLRNLFFPPPTKGANYLYTAAFASKYRNATGVYLSFGKVQPVSLRLQPAEISQLLKRDTN